jgi:hypothetical protein
VRLSRRTGSANANPWTKDPALCCCRVQLLFAV